MSTYGEEQAAACNAVRLAAVLCKKVQRQLKSSEKTSKEDASPVTIADYGAQAVVAWSLRRAFPDTPLQMVAEEDSSDLKAGGGAAMTTRITELVNSTLEGERNGEVALTEGQVLDLIDSGASEGGAEGRHWVLDPIDGTRGFVGLRQYAVCLGMLQAGKVVLGVLGCPNMPTTPLVDADGSDGAASHVASDGAGVLFTAQLGCGAAVAPLSDSGVPQQRIFVSESGDHSQSRFMESFESKHSDHTFTAKLGTAVGVSRAPLRLDSQAKYGALSRGDADLFLRFPAASYREKIWDHAAGAIIVTEAGGCISDASGAPLDFSKGRWLDLDRGIVASKPSLHAAVIKALMNMSPSS